MLPTQIFGSQPYLGVVKEGGGVGGFFLGVGTGVANFFEKTVGGVLHSTADVIGGTSGGVGQLLTLIRGDEDAALTHIHVSIHLNLSCVRD